MLMFVCAMLCIIVPVSNPVHSAEWIYSSHDKPAAMCCAVPRAGCAGLPSAGARERGCMPASIAQYLWLGGALAVSLGCACFWFTVHTALAVPM